MSGKYRLYYNDDGIPLFYSMEELEGKFIFVELPVFESSRYDIKIVDGKIRSLNDTVSKYHLVSVKTKTTVMCDQDDISILNIKKKSYKLWDYKSSN
jgi:hypothetical protein